MPLTAWQNFYVIIGSSAAALTGLQFVVIALIAQSRMRPTSREIAAFGSPTVVHFCSALFISGTMTAPWQSLQRTGITILACGIAGAAYVIAVARRARGQTGYQLVFEDWLWHAALPIIAYTTLLVAAIILPRVTIPSLFSIGATTLLLVYIGIHNAWDAVVYMTLNHLHPSDKSQDEP